MVKANVVVVVVVFGVVIVVVVVVFGVVVVVVVANIQTGWGVGRIPPL